MKPFLKIAILGVALALPLQTPVCAQEGNAASSSLQVVPQQQAEDSVQKYISYLQKEWARIKYQVKDKDDQLAAIHKLEEHALWVTSHFPDRAEPKIWEGIILSTDAGIVKGLKALGKVKRARKLFQESLKIDENALDGSAHTSLGSLYYQVPGWPIGFGDDDKADAHLRKALAINPDGIDPNYFYGDFLLKKGNYKKAIHYLEHALEAEDRPGREVADAGRRDEISKALATAKEKLKSKGNDFN